MVDPDFDIVVIGSGPGGYTAAVRAAKLGKKVAVIEKDEIGGVCLNKGCIPTKALIESARLYSRIKRAKEFGINAGAPSFDWKAVLERRNNIVIKLRKGLEYLFRTNNIEFIKGKAKVLSPGEMKIELPDGTTKTITCTDLIISTGSNGSKPAGFESSVTSDDLLEIPEIPKKLSIVGAGAVGIEFGYIFNAFGTEVSICEMLPRVLPEMDEDISKALERSLVRKGINIETGVKAVPIERTTDNLQLTTGRKSNNIAVDERMRTKDKGIYAIGDITGKANYAHVAEMQGIVAAENICGMDSKMDYSAVPSCVFCEPEVSAVGITEKEAGDKGMEITVSKYNFAALGKAAAMSEPEGFAKLISGKKSGKILGCHIIGAGAGDLIAEATLAVRKGLTVKDLAGTIHAHPTLPEILWEAARG